MSIGGGGGQLQEIASRLEEFERIKEALETEIEGLQEQKQDIDEATDAIAGLENDATVQVPLGGGAYVRANIEDVDEIIVELGANYAAERDREGAIETLESKQEILDERIADVRSEIAEIEGESQQLEQQAQQLQQQQLQQQQFQQQDE